jgi:hypothetical protein
MTFSKRLLQIALFVLASAFTLPAQTQDSSHQNLPTFVVQDVGKKFSLIAYGDMRFTNPEDHGHTNPEVRQALVKKIAEEKPSVLLISGDVPYRGGKQEDWGIFDAEFQPVRDAKIRIYPALGNHELADGEAAGLENWWKRFPELQGRRWYSVQFGNCYFIVLDSDSELTADSPQWTWMTSQLAHLPKETDFVFLTMHHPSYTDSHEHMIPGGGHSARPQEQELAKYLEELQPKLRARLIAVAGHVHNYERFEKNSVTYLVSGGGGATPYLFDRSAADKYQGAKGPNYHYLRFEIDGPKLKAKMVKLTMDEKSKANFEEKDSFEVSAEPTKK